MTSPDPMPVRTPVDDAEPEGFGDAVQAAALMLAMMTALAWVGFQWQRNGERAAHSFAVDMVEEVSRHGERALLPVWSGFGPGSSSPDARRTFRAMRALGALVPMRAGRCRVASRFTLCRGTRYDCRVSGATSVGQVEAVVGLCRAGTGTPYTVDTLDLTLPMGGNDRGGRGHLFPSRDGLERYGSAPGPVNGLPEWWLHRRGSPTWS